MNNKDTELSIKLLNGQVHDIENAVKKTADTIMMLAKVIRDINLRLEKHDKEIKRIDTLTKPRVVE